MTVLPMNKNMKTIQQNSQTMASTLVCPDHYMTQCTAPTEHSTGMPAGQLIKMCTWSHQSAVPASGPCVP
eukprot:6348192-Amphidinium_carterae.1